MKNFIQLALLIGCGIVAAGGAHAQTWMDSDWDRRIPFSADPNAVAGNETFTEFTLLLALDAANFSAVFAEADSLGADLVITAGDGTTVLDHEVVHYDPVAQSAEVWFRTPTLSDTDNEFFLYYMNTAGSAPPAAGAWTPDNLAVYHFSEDPSLGSLKDWGPNGGDAVAAVAPHPVGPGWQTSDRVAGQISSGWRFDGVDLWAYTDNVASADSSFTVSVWFANDSNRDKGAMAFHGPLGAWNLDFQRTGSSPYAAIETQSGSLSWNPRVVDAAPHHYLWSLDADADTVRFYFDGIERTHWFRYTPLPGGKVWTSGSVNGRLGIAGPWAWNALDVSDGVVDEFRILQGVRSADWVLTEYRNMSDPASFYVVGNPEARPTATGPWAMSPFGGVTVSPNPFRAVAWIDVETARTDVEVQVYDARGRLVRTLPVPRETGSGFLRYLWDGRDGQGTQVSNGIYFIRALSGAHAVTGKALLVR